MSTIPLPALDVKPPAAPPNPLDEYGKMVAMYQAQQNTRQQQALAPMQQQAAQQQVQAGQVDLQMKQQQLKDQQAMSATMQQWGQPKAQAQPAASADGAQPPSQPVSQSASAMPSYDDLVPLAIKNGASFQAVQQLQTHVLDMKTKASTVAMDDARAGASNAEAMKTKNGLIVDAMTGVLNTPDAQLPQAIQQTAQQLAQQGLFDPQHVQQAMQLATMAQQNPGQARQMLQLNANSLGAYSKLLDEAQKKVALEQEQGKSDPKSPFYAPSAASVALGTAPGAGQIQAGEATQAGRKAAAEAAATQPFKLALQQQAAAGSAGAGGAGGAPVDWGSVAQKYGMSPQAFDQQAEHAFSTGQYPPIGRSPNAIAMSRDLMNRIAELHPNTSLAANSAEFKANSASLKNLQTNFDQVQAFEQTATKNMDLLEQTAKTIPDLGWRFANTPVRQLTGRLIGTDNMAAFSANLATAQTEAAKVLNSANAGGVLSDSARHELQTIIDPNSSFTAIRASLNALKQDMGNRTQAYQQQIADIKGRLSGGAAQPAAAANAAQPGGAPVTITLPSGKTMRIE